MGSYAPTVGSVILLHRLSRSVSNDRRSTRTTMSVVSDDPPKIESFQRAEDPMVTRASLRGRSHNLAIRRNLHLGLLDDLLGRHRHPGLNSPTVGAPVCCVVACDGLRRRHEKRDGGERHGWWNQKSASRDHFLPLVERAMNEHADDAFDSRITCATAPQPAGLTTRRSVFSTTPIRHLTRGEKQDPHHSRGRGKTAGIAAFFTCFLHSPMPAATTIRTDHSGW